MVRSAEELFAIDKMAAAGVGNKKIDEALGVPLSTTKRTHHPTPSFESKLVFLFSRFFIGANVSISMKSRSQLSYSKFKN